MHPVGELGALADFVLQPFDDFRVVGDLSLDFSDFLFAGVPPRLHVFARGIAEAIKLLLQRIQSARVGALLA